MMNDIFTFMDRDLGLNACWLAEIQLQKTIVGDVCGDKFGKPIPTIIGIDIFHILCLRRNERS